MNTVNWTRILATTDFSPLANRAVDYAHGLAEQSGGELHVLHVTADPSRAIGEHGQNLTLLDWQRTSPCSAAPGADAWVQPTEPPPDAGACCPKIQFPYLSEDASASATMRSITAGASALQKTARYPCDIVT